MKTPEKVLKRRTRLGGREDLAIVYNKAKDIIFKYDLLRLYHFEEVEGIKRLTICNLWRVERNIKGEIRLFRFCITEESWQEQNHIKANEWPAIPLFPIKKTNSLHWYHDVLSDAIYEALKVAGFRELPQKVKGNENAFNPQGMKDILIRFYIGRYKKTENEFAFSGGRKNHDFLKNCAKAIRSRFYEHFYEREVLSAIMVIDYKVTSFVDYFRYAMHREGFLKVAREHRNLLPLLGRINPECWTRDDLFSRKLWVKDGRKTTALERPPMRKNSFDQFTMGWVAFEAPAAWKWLLKASPVVVKELDRSNRFLVTNIALANINFKAPVIAYKKLILSRFLSNYKFESVHIQRLIRLFLAHCVTLWQEKGFKEFRVWLKTDGSRELSGVTDYLREEGLEAGQPDKNATWASLLRRSENWHRLIAIRRIEREEKFKNCKWESLIPEDTIDGISFKALVSPAELAVEGYEMHHCVGTYAHACVDNQYRVFAAIDKDGTRSTLGLYIDKRSARLDQHYGKYNADVSSQFAKAGKVLVKKYQKMMR